MAAAGVRKSAPENNKLRTAVIMRICAARFLQKTRTILVISKTDRIQAARAPATRRFGATEVCVSRHFALLKILRGAMQQRLGFVVPGRPGLIRLADRRAKSISRRVIYFCERGQYIGTIPPMQNNIPSSDSRLGKKSAIHQGALACQSTMDGWPTAKYP